MNDLVVGTGNAERGDDAIGRIVAQLLRGRVAANVQILEHDGEATSLLDVMRGAERVWLIDAAFSGAPPGTVHRIDCAEGVPLPPGPVSSHGFGVAEAIGLGRALGTLPAQCVVYAIEGVRFDVGAGASRVVLRAADAVVQRILAEIVNLRRGFRCAQPTLRATGNPVGWVE